MGEIIRRRITMGRLTREETKVLFESIKGLQGLNALSARCLDAIANHKNVNVHEDEKTLIIKYYKDIPMSSSRFEILDKATNGLLSFERAYPNTTLYLRDVITLATLFGRTMNTPPAQLWQRMKRCISQNRKWITWSDKDINAVITFVMCNVSTNSAFHLTKADEEFLERITRGRIMEFNGKTI